MSKKNNVHPNYYKIGGREHAEGHGEAIDQEKEKQEFAETNKQNFIPGDTPVGEKKKSDR